MKNIKRIAALSAVVVLICMYGITLVFALIDHPMSSSFLMASIACTIILPVLLYAYLLVYKMVHKKDEESHKPESDSDNHI